MYVHVCTYACTKSVSCTGSHDENAVMHVTHACKEIALCACVCMCVYVCVHLYVCVYVCEIRNCDCILRLFAKSACVSFSFRFL